MALAWIGGREALVERAVEQASTLLLSSRCPVFTLDTDVHSTRAAIALAERVGAVCDQIEGDALAREVALLTDKGGMFISPGEVRRRADIVVIVGALPEIYDGLIAGLASTSPDLPAPAARTFFHVGDEGAPPPALDGRAVALACTDADLNGTLAALRARCAGRQVAAPVSIFDRFAGALAQARFAVFVYSGHGCDGLAMEMLQGLIGDLNRTSRASALFLPASERAWGSALASAWVTGFPLRVGFGRGFPEFDPWRFDAARMIEAGEADFQLWVSGSSRATPEPRPGTSLVALARTAAPVTGAAVTIAIGEAGLDHDAVLYAASTGSFVSVSASAPSPLPPAAAIIHAIAGHVPAGAPLPC